MKQHSTKFSSTDPSNPLSTLLVAVAGVHTSEKPRQKSAVNCWAKSQSAAAAIQQLVRQACIANSVEQKNSVAVWNKIAKEQFSKLPQDKQRYWEQRAKDDHVKDIDRWKAAREAEISTKPEDRQRCISGIVRLGQEFMDRLAEATGWKWSLIGGGPEPASEGRLTVISLHGGTTNGGVNLNFGQKERELYISQILPVFSKFLKECYTLEECRRQALTAVDAVPLENAGLDDLGISYHVVDPSEASAVGTAVPMTAPSVSAYATVGHKNMSSLRRTVSTLDSASTTNHQIERGREREHCSPAPRDHSPPAATAPSRLASLRQSPSAGGRSITSSMSPPLITVERRVLANGAPMLQRPVAGDAISNGSKTTSPTVPSSAPVGHTPNTVHRVADLEPDEISASATTSTGPTGDLDPDFISTTHTSDRKRRASPHRSTPPEKRARAPSVPPASSPSPLSDQPWFNKALDMLQANSLGEGWTNLVRTWIKFEEANHHRAQTCHSAAQRPTGASEVIDRGMPLHSLPITDNSNELGDQRLAWWNAFQLHRRVHGDAESSVVDGDAGKVICVDNGDIEELRKPGENKLLSILSSLYFWGIEVKDGGKESKKWVQAVDDCAFVLRILSSAP